MIAKAFQHMHYRQPLLRIVASWQCSPCVCAHHNPSCLPAQAALYDQLLGGALQVFYRTTTQGRYQHKIQQIK